MLTAPIRVVAGALIQDRRVLAAQRPEDKHQGGLWELPGGKVEPDEDDRDALARELLEELGVHVRVGLYVATHTHTYAHGRITLVLYLCTTDDTPMALEHSALRWVQAHDALNWAPADLPLLRELWRTLATTA